MGSSMEKVAEERAAAASGAAVPVPRRIRHGARSFGDMCFARYAGLGSAALVREEDLDAIADALFERIGCEPAGKRGRGEVLRFPLHDGHGLIRICRRGGLVRHVLKDSYLLENRPFLELRVHALLYGKGLSVPEPLGAIWRRRRVLYRGAVATREIKGGTLLEYLSTAPPEAEATLRAAGTLIRQMHDLGVYHADLQVRNVLVGNDGRLYLIDFDNAQCLYSVSKVSRARNLLRFRRSLQKNGLSPSFFNHVLEGYGGFQVPAWLDALYRLKGLFSDVFSGRAFRGYD